MFSIFMLLFEHTFSNKTYETAILFEIMKVIMYCMPIKLKMKVLLFKYKVLFCKNHI